MAIEFAFIIGLAVLLLLAIKFKVNAFVSLLISALTIGILSGMNLPEVIKTMTGGFGKTVSSIGIVIIFGVMLGKYLEDSRGAEKMARTLAKAVGEKRSPMAMALSGYLISIRYSVMWDMLFYHHLQKQFQEQVRSIFLCNSSFSFCRASCNPCFCSTDTGSPCSCRSSWCGRGRNDYMGRD